MNEEKIYEYIDALADKFNTTAEQVVGIMIKQTYIDSLTGIMFGSIFLTIGILLLLVIHKNYKAYKKDDCSKNFFFEEGFYRTNISFTIWGIIALFATGLFLLVGSVSIISSIYDLITLLLNPDYIIVREIKALLKP